MKVEADTYISNEYNREHVLELLQQMNSVHRLLLVRRYIDKVSMRELVAEIGWPESRIAELINAALRAFKGLLLNSKGYVMRERNARHELFMLLCKDELWYSASDAADKLQIKSTTAKLYLEDFHRKCPSHVLRSSSEGAVMFRVKLSGRTPDSVYEEIKKTVFIDNDGRVMHTKRGRKTESAPIASSDLEAAEKKLFNDANGSKDKEVVEKVPVRTVPKVVQESAAPTQQHIELVIKVRIQVQVEKV